MKEIALTVLLVGTILLSVAFSVYTVVAIKALPEPSPMKATISLYGMEYYLLSNEFGPMETWTEEQKDVAWKLLDCTGASHGIKLSLACWHSMGYPYP